MMTRGCKAVRVPAAGLLSLALIGLLGPLEASAEGTALGPGGLFDGDTGALYAMSPDGRLEALEAASGRVLWRTGRAARPLALHEGRLLARAATGGRGAPLAVVLLDPADPERGGVEVRIPLPDAVDPSIDDGPGRRFLATGSFEGDDVVVSWSFCEQRAGGVDPGAAGEACVDGAFRFDAATGKGGAMPSSGVRLPAQPALPERLTRLVASGRLPGRLWRVDGRIVAAREEREGAKRRVSLQRFDATSGEPLGEVLLFEDTGERVVRYPSADGRHLLASGPDPAAGAGAWRWFVYDLASGEPAGELVSDLVGARFVVLGPTLVHDAPRQRRRAGDGWIDEPLRLRAVSLATGEVLWSRPVRDPTWWGPVAPVEPPSSEDPP